MSKKLFLTDVDGCLLDWFGGFTEWMVDKGYTPIPDTGHLYNVNDRFEGIDTIQDAIALIKEFNGSDKFAQLKPHLDAVEGVKELVKRGYTLVPITLMGTSPETRQHRIDNLTAVFGAVAFDFDKLWAVDIHHHKEEAFDHYKDTGLFYVEDHLKHALAAHEYGLKVLNFYQEYNSGVQVDKFPVVNSWSDVIGAVDAAAA